MSITLIKPDGVSVSSDLVYSTTKQSIFLNGRVSEEDSLEVVYEGVSYSVDIQQDNTWTFPSPLSLPDGIDIVQGQNSFTFIGKNAQGINISRLTSVIVLSGSSSQSRPTAPTEVLVNRYSDYVEITFTHSEDSVSAYHIYASTVSGGGSEGYARINLNPIDPPSYGKVEEVISVLDTQEINTVSEVSDPLFAQYILSQTEQSGAELKTTLSNRVEVPETVSRLRLETTLKSVVTKTKVTFRHNRTAFESSQPATIRVARFAVLPKSTPIYYVVTAVKFVNEEEIESAYSAEVSGKPVEVLTTTSSIPIIGRRQLTENMIKDIYNAQPEISVQAGSVFRDVIVDPFVSEAERSRFVLDFCYRATSFSSLLQLDDPLGAGTSIQVNQSNYKKALGQALFLSEDIDIQTIIDQSFDRLASNLGIVRRAGEQARGEVVFYTTVTPTFTLNIPNGTVVSGGGQQFRTTETASIPLSSAASYYNPTTRRYSISVPIIALDAGSAGNLTSGQINSGAPTGLRVTNDSPTFGGEDAENNNDLTARAIGILSSIDTGTKAGYQRVSRASAGVIDSFVVGADDLYMKRDQGLGGKVDVWIRGESSAVVTDVFAPRYGDRLGVRFLPVGGEGTYRFQVQASDALIFEMIDRSDLGLGLKNSTIGQSFDLTGYTIDVSKTVIQLDSSINQPAYSITDIILGDWRSEVSNDIILRRQPVSEIVSVSTADGTSISDYTFSSSEDPLYLGRSNKAQDKVNIPSLNRGAILTATDEGITLIGEYRVQLAFLGADTLSIEVKNGTNQSLYLNPFTSSSPDYLIETEEDGSVFLRRTVTSSISDGETVLVRYNYRENIVITYSTNLVVNSVQADMDKTKHLAADVLVKEALPAPVNIKGQVILFKGYSPADVDALVKVNLENLINSTSLGGSIFSSDVIREIDRVEGVNYVQVPLSEIALAENTLILREDVSSTSVGSFQYVPELSDDSEHIWKMSGTLRHNPEDGGGDGALVTVDNNQISLLTATRSSSSDWKSYSASIVGNDGLNVSDGQGGLTLLADSANRLFISLPVGVNPTSVTIQLNYRTGSPTGTVKDLVLNNLSYFTVGEFSFTYEETR